MSHRTGLGPVETELLLTLDRLGARHDRPHRKSANVVDALEELGFNPRHAYETLCDLARPWQLMVPLVDLHGNYGSPDHDDAAAHPSYTEARTNPIGSLAVDAERGIAPALPIDLMNGTMWRGGKRPAFDPVRMLGALLAVHRDRDLSDDAVVALVGPPAFPTGCEVHTDVQALVAGHAVRMSCCARSEQHDRNIVLTNFPPGSSSSLAGRNIAARANLGNMDGHAELAAALAIPLRDLRDESRGLDMTLVCEAKAGSDLDDVERRLRAVWGVSVELDADLGQPLTSLLRGWLAQHDSPGTARALLELRALISPA